PETLVRGRVSRLGLEPLRVEAFGIAGSAPPAPINLRTRTRAQRSREQPATVHLLPLPLSFPNRNERITIGWANLGGKETRAGQHFPSDSARILTGQTVRRHLHGAKPASGLRDSHSHCRRCGRREHPG